MPKGPQGQKRLADVMARAMMIGRNATGEAEDDVGPVSRRDIGQAGGRARNASLSQDRRKEIAVAAASARWS